VSDIFVGDILAMTQNPDRLTLVETALASVIKRLTAVENCMARGDDLPLESVEEGSAQDRRITKPQLAARWAKSPRTIDRMRHQPGFPPPDIVNGQCEWWLSIIQQYERATQAGGKATDNSQYLPRNKAPAAALKGE
jgi:hypothetical protein